MPLLVPGAAINEILEVAQSISTGKPDTIVLVTTRTAAGTAAANTPTQCASTAELTTKIGTVPTVTLASFERIRAIAPNAKIWVCAGLDPAATPTQVQNLVAGLNGILRASALPLSFMVVPEVALMATQGDRTSVNQAAETVAATNGFDFLYFGNFGSTTDTKAKADTEAALYTSPQGNSQFYWGIERDATNRDIPLSISAVAWQVSLLQNLAGFYPAAGMRCPIGSIDPKYLPTLIEANSIMEAKGSYNFAWSANGVNYLWNDTTRSPDEGWSFINSRIAMSTIQAWANEQLGGLQFSPADPNPDESGFGQTSRELIGRLTSVAERGKAEGAIVDYKIEAQPIVAGKARLTFRVRPIQSSKFIEVNLINTPSP